MVFKSSKQRAFAKTISWNIIFFTVSIIFYHLFFNEKIIEVFIGSEILFGTTMYYIHERYWYLNAKIKIKDNE